MTETHEQIAAPVLPEQEKKKNRSVSEIYDAVVGDIQGMYENKLSEKEAHEAARNLIGFCQKVIEIRSREIK